ncbi:ERF family protein [Streptomyces sp. NPDC058405]|uniref:ERF family protein n=1 Tax=Streptomyces sp. NPDC058405 TaxID=3346482 RepID=UPI003655F3FC
MSSLAGRAAAAAGRTEVAEHDDLSLPTEFTDQFPAPDPMAGYEPGDEDPEMVPVHIAWLRVRRDIRAIAKGEKYDAFGTKFNFRGVDTVVNVFGPVTLKHGVNVLSSEVEAEYGEKTTKNGAKMRECITLVRWTIMGPMGDTLTLQTRGEALDTADKSTTKSQSVALRTLLLSFGLTPTHDTDPDADRIERGEAPARSANSYRDEIIEPGTTVSRLRQIGGELSQLKMLGSKVINEVGDEETLDSLGRRIAAERAGGGA